MNSTPFERRIELEIERNVKENGGYKKGFSGFSLALNGDLCDRISVIAE